MILGRYLGVHPRKLHFFYGANGKPELATVAGDETLRFNLSHSDGLALLAVTRGRQIGVDLERIRKDLAGEQIAARFFSPRETAELHAVPGNAKPAAFFNCWARKEAFIKATGEGLSCPLDLFDVSLVPGEPAALLSVRGDSQEASRWALRELMAGSGYAAALAVEGDDWRLRRYAQRP